MYTTYRRNKRFSKFHRRKKNRDRGGDIKTTSIFFLVVRPQEYVVIISSTETLHKYVV